MATPRKWAADGVGWDPSSGSPGMVATTTAGQNSLYANRESRTRPPASEDDCPGAWFSVRGVLGAVLEGMWP